MEPGRSVYWQRVFLIKFFIHWKIKSIHWKSLSESATHSIITADNQTNPNPTAVKLIVDEKDSRIVIEGDVNTDDVESLLKDTLEFVKQAVLDQRQFFIDAKNARIQDFTFYVWLLSLGKYVFKKDGLKIGLKIENPPFDDAMATALQSYFETERLLWKTIWGWPFRRRWMSL